MIIFQHQATEAKLTGDFQKYVVLDNTHRVASLAMYGEPSSPRYAYVFHPAPATAPAQRLFPNLDPAAITGGTGGELAEQQRGEQFLPKLISVTGLTHTARYAMVFEHADFAPPFWPPVYLRVTRKALYAAAWGEQSVLAALNQSLRSVDTVFNLIDNRVEHAAVVWPGAVQGDAPGFSSPPYYPSPTAYEGPVNVRAYTGTVGDDIPGWDRWEAREAHRVQRSGWVRPEMVVASPIAIASPELGVLTRPIYTYWVGDTLEPWPEDLLTFTGGVIVKGPMLPSQVHGADVGLPFGYKKYRVSASGSGDGARICILYAKNRTALPRHRVVVSGRGLGSPDRVSGTVVVEPRKPPPKVELPPGGGWPISGSSARVREDRSNESGDNDPYLVDIRGFPNTLGSPLLAPVRRGKRASPAFPDATPYQGGGPPGDQPNQPGSPLDNAPPPTSYPNDFTALDAYVFDMLEAMGCRAAQLAIARAGKLVIARSYTWAEEGYPVAKNQHLFRLGSISKPLTGMAVVGHFATTPHVTDFTGSSIVGPNGSLGFELVNPSPELAAKLAETTLYDLLSHSTGWPGSFDESDSAAAGGHPLPALPGDATERIRKATADFYIEPIGTAQYGATVVQVLGEGVSWIRTKGEQQPQRSQYESQMQAWWFGSVNAGQSRGQLARVGAQASLDGGQFPCHSRRPGVETGYISGVATRQPTTYAGNPPWSAGAGAWCMSAADLVRIWSGLDPSASVMQHLLTPAQMSLIRNDLRAPSGFSALFGYGGPLSAPATQLAHGGATHGCCSLAILDFSEADPLGRSMVSALLLDTDDIDGIRPTVGDLSNIRNIVLAMEQAGDFTVDLLAQLP